MLPDQVTVVVPTYNERENLEDIVRAVMAHGYRPMIVDDSSPDGTGEIADGLTERHEKVSVLHRANRQGLGPAYAAAFHQLLDGESDVIIEMDADFSHDLDDLPRLLEVIEAGGDLAIGSRYVPGGDTPDWPSVRRMISRGGNLYARVMLGIPVADTTVGFRAFRSEALRKLPYGSAEASGYGFQVEMAWRASEAGLTITEVRIASRIGRGESRRWD